MSSPAILIEGLVKRYAGRDAVAGLDLCADQAQVTALLGPNGAGKTTTVECCEGFRRPDLGRVRVLGLDPDRESAQLRPRIGVMLQSGGIYPAIRAGEMLRHVARLFARPLDLDQLVGRLALESALTTPYRRLSGGQQQRLALALALVGRPEFVFLDEPTAGLDPQARHATWDLISELRRDGVGVLLTTHSMEEAERLADRVFIVDHGRLVAQGTVQDLTAGGSSIAHFTTLARIDAERLQEALPLGVHLSAEAGTYTLTGAVGPATLAALGNWCEAEAVTIEHLEIRRRNLEEVFLELTGRAPRDG
ncbi:MAG TPA: ABC transporter ATP-binding protein [Candidatus Nitrosotalea sp.]|nr:ABC transporter ATP-binding protein [Candidatus Nitrosotalea sp.]